MSFWLKIIVGAAVVAAAKAATSRGADAPSTAANPPSTVLETNLKRLRSELADKISLPRIAIMGQAGAGKSTLLKKITANQVRPTPVIGSQTDATTWADDPSVALLHWWKRAVFVDVPGYGTPSHPIEPMSAHFPADQISHAIFVIKGKIRADDIKMHRVLRDSGVPFVIVRTYADELDREVAAADIRSHLGLPTTVSICFADNRTDLGLNVLSSMVKAWM
ncbi:MAG: GTPase [Bacteroidota bacterium]